MLLDLRLSYNTYYELGKILSKNFKNIFATLEGGYNTDTLPQCTYNFLDGINQKPIKYKEQETESSIKLLEQFEKTIQMLEKNLK